MSSATHGQEALTRPGICIDQHERKWSCLIEKKTGYPVGILKPHGWRAPWRPPQGTNTFVFSKDEPNRFRINYEAILEERLNEQHALRTERQKAAVVRGWAPDDPEKQEALDNICGSIDKLQPPEIIVACMKGDKWILGLTDVENPKVAKYLPKKVSRTEALLSRFKDLDLDEEPASLADDLEARMDLQEEFDPDATPKGRVPMKPKKPAKAVA